jgi:chromosome segregation ATPase
MGIEAEANLSEIHRWIERNHPDGFIDSQTYWQNLERVTENWYDRIDAIEADARRFVRERDEARRELENMKQTKRELMQMVYGRNFVEQDLLKQIAKLRAELDQLKEVKK